MVWADAVRVTDSGNIVSDSDRKVADTSFLVADSVIP